MDLFVGTSGYSYKEWKGSFYPAKLPQKDMLGYYAERFGVVELNNTFYRAPRADELAAMGAQTPPTFQFAVKAPQTITHRKRLQNADEVTKNFLAAVDALQGRAGPLLFQLPPNFKKDLERLRAFVKLLGGTASAFEFRHESWFDDEVHQCLRESACAWCVAEMDETPNPAVVSTADWGYVRLRRETYSDEQLLEWIKKIQSQAWRGAYVFFKHEDTGTGPDFASRFLALAAQQT